LAHGRSAAANGNSSGAQDEQESIGATRAGLNLGINWIDTAAVYELGHSEIVVGRAIRGLGPRPYVFHEVQPGWDDAGKISHNLQAAFCSP
jgi:aryl-alcohol dehydrogenase-like predicted oxidoreductase